MDRVKGKVAIVTGGASGIGEATAKLFAKEGARIAIIDIDDDNGKRVESEIKALGGPADYWHVDISQENEVAQTFSEIINKYNQLDILVNNAGITGYRRPIHETTVEEWDQVMNVNLKGTFFCTKHAVPYMLKSGGSVINVSSIMGIVAGPTTVYETSKAGIRHFTKSNAVNYARSKIRFNSVHPGYIVTPLFTKLAAKSALGVEKSIEDESSRIPLGRMGLPEDIANGILFLASDESSYITGAELVIDGGKVII